MSTEFKIKNLWISIILAVVLSAASGATGAQAPCLMGALCAAACDQHEPSNVRQECFQNCRKTCEERVDAKNLPVGDPCSDDQNCASNACALTQPNSGAQIRKRCCPIAAGKVFIVAEFGYTCRGMPTGSICVNDATCASNRCTGGFFNRDACE